jgi:rhomboid family protein
VLLPNAQVLTLFFFVIIFFLQELPAWVFLAVYFVLQAWTAGFQLQHPPEGGGTAVFAHIGGIAFGFLTVKLFQSRRPLRPRL